jgi:hypothetical protein
MKKAPGSKGLSAFADPVNPEPGERFSRFYESPCKLFSNSAMR